MEFESLEVIGEKLKAIAKVNQEVIDVIEATSSKQVVSRYDYSLKCELSSTANSSGDKPWKLVATPKTESVWRRTCDWRYKGEPLETAEDFFNDRIKYEMKSYEDVKRLNTDLLKVGSKYCDLLADKPRTREGLNKFLRNLEKVQVAVGQLNELIIDAKEEVSGSDIFNQGMSEIVSGFRKVHQMVDKATLKVRTGFRIFAKYHLNEGHIPIDKINVSVALDVESFTTIGQVKTMIHEKDGIFRNKYRLHLNGHGILNEDLATLNRLGIGANSTLFILCNADVTAKKGNGGKRRRR